MSKSKSNSSRKRELDRLNNYLLDKALEEEFWEESEVYEEEAENSRLFLTKPKKQPKYLSLFGLYRIKVGYRNSKSKEDDYDVDTD